MRLGELQVDAILDGEFRSPATEVYPASTPADWETHARWLDDDGNLEMPIGCFVVRTGDRVVLIDTGLGRIRTPMGSGGRLLEGLAGLGLEASDVTDVVLTHLHFDHVGGTTRSGEITFPRATYRCHREDWAHFVTSGREEGAARKLGPLTDRIECWDGQTTLAPGVDTQPTPGHTPGHTAIVLSGGTERAIVLGDAVHCPIELEASEIGGIGDVDPALAARTREAIARELEESGMPATGCHVPGLSFGRLMRAEGKRRWVV